MAKVDLTVELFADSGRPRSRGHFFEAASLLTSFLPAQLRAADGSLIDRQSLDILARNCDTTGSEWILDDAVRRDEIHALESLEVPISIWKNNAENCPDDPVQKMLQQVVRESVKVDELDSTQLSSLLRVLSWFGTSLISKSLRLPSIDEVRAEFGYKTWCDRLTRYRTPDFLGREQEMDELYRFMVSPLSFSATVWGVGGVGKTALLSNFVLEHCLNSEARRPFAWFDFNRSDLLNAESPNSLLLEAASQLSQQRIVSVGTQSEIEDFCRDMIDGPIISRQLLTSQQIIRFGKILQSSGTSGIEYIWVLDSLEELLETAPGFIDYITAYLEELREIIPQLRVFFVGRSQYFGDTSVRRELHLQCLELSLAREFLERGGVPEAESLFIANACGKHPLRLSLAASIYRQAMKDRQSGSPFEQLRFLSTTLPKGSEKTLFLRFLEHLHDDDIKRLVAPGFLVRRITPLVIEKILAEPCGLEVRSAVEATAVFQKLIREVSLIESVDDETAVLRRDVRKELLPLIRSAFNHEANAIHTSAIEFYRFRRNDESRAEEVYHRLMIGTDARTLDRCWRPSLAERLVGSIDEMPFRSQVYLARKTGRGTTVPTDYFSDRADNFDWEWRVASRARSLLDHDEPEKAIALVRERDFRSPTSPLYVIESRALRRLGKLAEGRRILENAANKLASLTNFGTNADRGHAIELLLSFFWIELDCSECLSARETLDDLCKLIGFKTDLIEVCNNEKPVLHLEILLRSIALSKKCPQQSSVVDRDLAYRKAHEILSDEEILEDHDFEDSPKMFRRLAAEVCWNDVKVVSRVVRNSGIGTPYPLACEVLGEEIARWSSGRFELETLGPIPVDCNRPSVWKHWFMRASSSSISDSFSRLIESREPPRKVMEAVRDLLLLSDEGPRTEGDIEYLKDIAMAQNERLQLRKHLRHYGHSPEKIRHLFSSGFGLSSYDVISKNEIDAPVLIREIASWSVRFGLANRLLDSINE
ncbi:hypothetical protein Psta_0288 [Pirellula staleyi DSM 6068]|uniref:Orc1-like AAA ATPase domain-containing protein n=1 Tax=Pirellula staleyi (strain ATCC 27377 / DSM 6068 / ICPB 4128) TaxID=530564 RepID=D2R1J6_PIRSD|nr:hypothetical protein [Pirellula staleyi]ADB14981.1 hypothetical protein Psta_0288 [Pirellula staleyi DSM 6068]